MVITSFISNRGLFCGADWLCLDFISLCFLSFQTLKKSQPVAVCQDGRLKKLGSTLSVEVSPDSTNRHLPAPNFFSRNHWTN